MTEQNQASEVTIDSAAPFKESPRWWVHALVTAAFLLLAVSIFKTMMATKPEARKFGGRAAPAVMVETAQLEPTHFEVWIDSYGSAIPLTQTRLVADVSGRVISVSPNIRAGSSFKKDEVLLQLDPRDFKVEVDIAKASVSEAEFKYKQELAQAEIAERDWNVRPGSTAGKELALRKPQVAAALASLNAAEARLARAELNLERTQVRAPFDGKVLKQMIDLGQVVSPQQSIADIYSTDFLEVRLPVKAHDLAHIALPDENAMAYRPKVIFEAEFGDVSYQWEGELVRSEGAFDTDTRMLFVVAQIKEPFVAQNERPALRVGQFLQAKIQGKELKEVFKIPRRAVSQNNEIALVEEGILQKLKIVPLWSDSLWVIVSAMSELDDGNRKSGNEKSGNVNSGMKNPTLRLLSATDTIILTPTANLSSGTRVKSMDDAAKPRERVSEKTKADAMISQSTNQPAQ